MLRGSNFRLSCLTILIAATAHAELQAQAPSEYQVKAAFLYNFIKFVEWPANPGKPGNPIALCVLGKDPFEGELERVVGGKTVDGRPLTVRRIGDASGAQSCQVLFVSASEAGRASEIVKKIAGWSVLTIGDTDELWEQGVMINLLMDGQKVRFRINQGAAERASLKISSKLLQLSVASVEKKNNR
jgi:hypothetical protein